MTSRIAIVGGGGGVGASLAFNLLTAPAPYDVALHATQDKVEALLGLAATLQKVAEEPDSAKLTPDQLESMEDMVGGVLALCDCPPELTGGIHISLDLIAGNTAGVG